jgi:uncharacterized membrane protein
MGVMLVGIAAGHALSATASVRSRHSRGAPRVLASLGRHSLAVYMLHQPILIVLLYVAVHH